MPVIEPSKSEAPEIEDGIYTVKCLSVEARRVENDQFGKNDKFEVKLRIEDLYDENGDELILNPLINQAWSEKANLFKWAIAFGLDVDPNESFDTDRLKNRRAQADIRTPEGGWPRVINMMALPKPRGNASTTPVAAAGAAEEQEGPLSPLLQFWANMNAAGLKRIDVVREAKAMFEKEPDALNDKQIATLEKVLLI